MANRVGLTRYVVVFALTFFSATIALQCWPAANKLVTELSDDGLNFEPVPRYVADDSDVRRPMLEEAVKDVPLDWSDKESSIVNQPGIESEPADIVTDDSGLDQIEQAGDDDRKAGLIDNSIAASPVLIESAEISLPGNEFTSPQPTRPETESVVESGIANNRLLSQPLPLGDPNSGVFENCPLTIPEKEMIDSPSCALQANSASRLEVTSALPLGSSRRDWPSVASNNQGSFGYPGSDAGPMRSDNWNSQRRHGNQITTAEASVEANAFDFSPPPCVGDTFDPAAEMNVYQGKQLFATQRPLIELGRPWYPLGELSPSQSFLGFHNPVNPQFIVFGDSRLGVASNKNASHSSSLIAWQTNLFFDLKLTGTERVHFNINPSTQGANNTRYVFNDEEFISEFNADINFGFFEGDVGAIMGGLTNKTLPFDLPIAIGAIPLVMQNGVWMEDAILGVAATIPARSSPLLGISNYDVTFFAGWDNINSPAFDTNNDVAKMYGVASWIDAMNGYFEVDYAFIEDRDRIRDRSYHNIGIGFTRRYGHFVSNSTRMIVNAGQSTDGGPNTADGLLLLSENSLITANPSTILPYFNMFAGFDRPQSAARNGQAGGVLRNTGILFESDILTGYPTLDPTANDTYGAALGLSLMPQNFGQQFILEAAYLGVMGDDIGRNATGDQKGVGFRYQLPLNNSVIFRMDGMFGYLNNSEDISGIRMEIRKKF